MGRTYSCWMLNCWCITWPVGFKSLTNTWINLADGNVQTFFMIVVYRSASSRKNTWLEIHTCLHEQLTTGNRWLFQIWFRNIMQDLRGIRLDTQKEQSNSSQEAIRYQSQCLNRSAVPCTWPLVSAMLFKHSEELVTGPRLEHDGSCTVNRVTVTMVKDTTPWATGVSVLE